MTVMQVRMQDYARLCSSVKVNWLYPFSLSKVHLEVKPLCTFELTKPSATSRWAMFHPSVHWCHWCFFPSTVLPYIQLDYSSDIMWHDLLWYIDVHCIYAHSFRAWVIHIGTYNTRQGSESSLLRFYQTSPAIQLQSTNDNKRSANWHVPLGRQCQNVPYMYPVDQ